MLELKDFPNLEFMFIHYRKQPVKRVFCCFGRIFSEGMFSLARELCTGYACVMLCTSFISTCLLLLCACLQEMIDEADKDGDGEVNETEFLRIMKKTNMY